MNLKKPFVIMLIIILLCSSSIIVFLIHNKKTKQLDLEDNGIIEQPYENIINTAIERVVKRNNFYMVKNGIDKFYTYYANIYNSSTSEKMENINAVYNILDEDYIYYRGITLNNIETKLSKINPVSVSITDMYRCQKDESNEMYFVYGNIRDLETSNVESFSIMVKVDLRNRTFKVLLQDYVNEKYNNIQIGDELEVNLPNEIEKNEYNTMEFSIILDLEYLTDIVNNYKNDMIYNPEQVYNNLDLEYREKRFKNIEDFKEYALQKAEKIDNLTIEDYKKENRDDYTQYVCLDNNGKYIIIRETSLMQYTLILDTYTLNLPEFESKYASVNNKNKVALNMEKIKEAINENDYEYVYNKLNETFRSNNFETYNDFLEDFKPRFFEENIFDYKEVKEETDTYTVSLSVQDGDEGKKNMTFVMKLLNDTDFEISYNVSK